MLQTPVSSSGHIYIKAHLVGPDLIYATRIRVKIGSISYESNPLNDNSSYITRKTISGKQHEILNLFSWYSDNKFETRSLNMISAIANSKETDSVILVFIGKKDNIEIPLSKENITAIRESWKLSQIIAYKGNKYVTNTLPGFSNMKPTTLLIPTLQLNKKDMEGVKYNP